MSDEDLLRERWLEWARSQGIPADRLGPAVDAALRVARAGAGAEGAAAAARRAGGRGQPADATLLQHEGARARTVREELDALSPSGPITAEALTALVGLFGERCDALMGALRTPAPTPAILRGPRERGEGAGAAAARPSPRAFFSEHSILLLSYVGAFLLVVAAVLYEVYAFGELNGALRFAGVLGLDLVFGAAGWTCLRSQRMRLVGHTYVAVSALLAPLVCVAAYVFLGLRRGISPDVALLLAGSALTVLYGVLSVRLRSHAYGYLALAALPAAWLGGIDAAGPGGWHGPVAAPLVAVYALAGFAARRLSALGERFTRHLVLYVHGAALLAVAVAVLISMADLVSWAMVATLAVLGAGYLLARVLSGTGGAAHLGLGALGLAWGLTAHLLGLGGWKAPAVVPLVGVYSLVGYAGRRHLAPIAAAARGLVHPAAAAAMLLTVLLWSNEYATGQRVAWWLPAALVVLAAAYVLHRVLSGQALALLPAAAAGSLAVLAANAAHGGGFTEAAAALLVLAAGWGVGAERTGSPDLRLALRAGLAVQALTPALFWNLPAAPAAAVLLVSTALLTAAAWRHRAPAWLLMAAAAFAVDWYWLGRALLPPAAPSATALALLYSPLPALLGIAGLGLRATVGRRWALPLYPAAAGLALSVPALALYGGDLTLAGRALMAYAAVAYAAAALDRSAPHAAIAVAGGGAGLVLAVAGAGAAPVWSLVALSLLAAGVYTGHVPWRGRRDLAGAHRYLGLAGSGGAGLVGFTVGDAIHAGSPDTALAALVVLAFAALLVVDERLSGTPLLDHAALVAGSLASYFAARFFGATNPQWYVAAPGLALTVAGLAMPHDARLTARRLAPPATAAGAALLLGATAAQAFTDASWGYTAWLVVEAIAAVLAGIVMRSRALVIAGAAAVGAGGLRALFVLVQQGLLFAAFGAAALFLLSLGAALAALRDRVRSPLGTAWREWR